MSVVVVTEATAPILTAVGARALTDQLRAALVHAHDLYARAYHGQAWRVIVHVDESGVERRGYPSWAAYCKAELVLEHAEGLGRGARREVAGQLDAAGLPKRAIAAALGVSDQTVRADLGAKRRPVEVPPEVEQQLPKTRQAALLLLEAGPRGMTVHELCRRTGWHHGSASRVLHDLERQRNAVRLPVYRAGSAVRVHPTHVPTD